MVSACVSLSASSIASSPYQLAFEGSDTSTVSPPQPRLPPTAAGELRHQRAAGIWIWIMLKSEISVSRLW
jgi:hypothetical protein